MRHVLLTIKILNYMNNLNIKSLIARYATGTFGLILVAIGVALSIKSDLGTAPISCPPYVVSLAGHFRIGAFTIGTVGQYTMLMHLIFIVLQILLLRSRFKLEHLMQIPAAIVFRSFDGCLYLGVQLGRREYLCYAAVAHGVVNYHNSFGYQS